MNKRTIIGLAALLALAGVVVYLVRKKMSTWSWPIKGQIKSPFGERIHPITGVKSGHNGIDIAAPIGTDIQAPADGTVKSIYTHESGGKSLILEHDGGWRTGYAHLNSYSVSVGQKVRQGDVIAQTGNTGASTGPHLHFTMTSSAGEKVDPVKYLA
jgi:murein DD-endopeptidase MepM/ murein hydrolase activator NlpD